MFFGSSVPALPSSRRTPFPSVRVKKVIVWCDLFLSPTPTKERDDTTNTTRTMEETPQTWAIPSTCFAGNEVVFHRQRFFSTARNPTYDVAIAGAGIMGLATAFQLKKVDPTLRVWCASGRLPWAMDPRGGAPVSCAPFTPLTRPCSWPWMASRPTAVGGSSWAFGTWKPPSPGPVPFGCSESPGASTRLSRAGWQPSAWTLKSWTRGTCDVLSGHLHRPVREVRPRHRRSDRPRWRRSAVSRTSRGRVRVHGPIGLPERPPSGRASKSG